MIKPQFLVTNSREHPTARQSLTAWQGVVEAARWKQFGDVRRTYSHADSVRVQSGRQVVVCNIKGNDFRLICAIHYNRGLIFLPRFFTRAEYSKNRWQITL
jgi:mRNA interferase HigB